MNQIGKLFGIKFMDGILCDPTNFEKTVRQPNFTITEPHPVLAGVKSIGGGLIPVSLQVANLAAEIVVRGDADAYDSKGYYLPGQRPPLVAIVASGSGHVVAIGSEGYFDTHDDDMDGVINLEENDNRRFALNVVQYLAGYR